MAKKQTKRFIDNDDVKEKLAEIYKLLLQNLKEKLDEGLIEAQEARLIWDMVKTHKIGIEGVDELAEKALQQVGHKIESLELDEEWSFEE